MQGTCPLAACLTGRQIWTWRKVQGAAWHSGWGSRLRCFSLIAPLGPSGLSSDSELALSTAQSGFFLKQFKQHLLLPSNALSGLQGTAPLPWRLQRGSAGEQVVWGWGEPSGRRRGPYGLGRLGSLSTALLNPPGLGISTSRHLSPSAHNHSLPGAQQHLSDMGAVGYSRVPGLLSAAHGRCGAGTLPPSLGPLCAGPHVSA